MKSFLFCAAGIFVLLLPACRHETLPELDASSAATLTESPVPGIFVSRVKGVTKQDTAIGRYRCAKACATVNKSWGYVVYPYTICTAPDFLLTSAVKEQFRSAGMDSLIPVLESNESATHAYSRVIDNKRFSLFCRTVGGPWAAELVDQEQCGFCGDGVHTFDLVILGLPTKPLWHWAGAKEDAPADAPALNNLAPSGSHMIDCNPTDLTNCAGVTGMPVGNGGVMQ